MKRPVNFWNVAAWFALALAASGVVWAGISGPVNKTTEAGTAIPSDLGKNPGPGKVLQLPTGTDQRGAYWATIKTLPDGTPGQIPQVKTGDGTGTATETRWEAVTPNYLSKNGVTCTNASTITAADGQITSCAQGLPVYDTRFVDEAPSDFPQGVRFDFKLNGANGLSDGGTYNSVMTWRRWSSGGDWSGGPMFQLAYTDAGNLWTRYSPLGIWSTWKKLTVSAPADIGAEPTLPACPPGQAVVYTGTGTGTSTAKGCGTLTGSSVSFSTSTPLSVGTSGSIGTSSQVNHADHQHDCPVATTGSKGCMSSTDKTKLDGLTADDHKVSVYGGTPDYLYNQMMSSGSAVSFGVSSEKLNVNLSYSTSTPATVGTGAVGTSALPSRSDHSHAIDGRTLVDSLKYTSASTYWASNLAGWTAGPSWTFTTTGSELKVAVQATIATDYDSYPTFCAMAITSDLGASASTQRGKEVFQVQTPYNGYSNTTTFPNVWLFGTLDANAQFNLGGSGQMTVSVSMYNNTGRPCRVPAGYLAIFIDVYK